MMITQMSLDKVQVWVHRLNLEKQEDIDEEGYRLHQRHRVQQVSLEWLIVGDVPRQCCFFKQFIFSKESFLCAHFHLSSMRNCFLWFLNSTHFWCGDNLGVTTHL